MDYALSRRNSGTVLYSMEGGGPMRIAFDSPVSAFGADYGSALSPRFATFTATLTLDSGQTFSFESPTNPDSTFFGFVVDRPIRSMTFSDGGKFDAGGGFFFHEEMIKDIYMVTAIPEPGSRDPARSRHCGFRLSSHSAAKSVA